jgi:DNA-binding transcriptional MerR regulator
VPDNTARLAIGELARRAGTAPSALRYYERIGLLPPAERAGGKRRYPPSSAERLAFVRLYQDAGFTLKEIRQLLSARSRRRASWTPLAEGKIAELDARIAEAQRAKHLLEHALNCPHDDLLTCPNFRPRWKPGSKRAHRPLGDLRHTAAISSTTEPPASLAG